MELLVVVPALVILTPVSIGSRLTPFMANVLPQVALSIGLAPPSVKALVLGVPGFRLTVKAPVDVTVRFVTTALVLKLIDQGVPRTPNGMDTLSSKTPGVVPGTPAVVHRLAVVHALPDVNVDKV